MILDRQCLFLPVFEACMVLSMMVFYLYRVVLALTEYVAYFLYRSKKKRPRDSKRLLMLFGKSKKESGIQSSSMFYEAAAAQWLFCVV